VNRVNTAQGDALRFKALYDSYRRAPVVTRKRLYLESMQKVLPQLGGKLLLDSSADGVLPLIPMDSFRNLVPQATQRRDGSQ
jgi:membrane protease subunit HflK